MHAYDLEGLNRMVSGKGCLVRKLFMTIYHHGCFEFTGSRYNNNVHVFDDSICDMMIIMITIMLTMLKKIMTTVVIMILRLMI